MKDAIKSLERRNHHFIGRYEELPVANYIGVLSIACVVLAVVVSAMHDVTHGGAMDGALSYGYWSVRLFSVAKSRKATITAQKVVPCCGT